MELTPPRWFAQEYPRLLARQPLTPGVMVEIIRDMVAARVDEVRAAAFLTALRMKGETSQEIAEAALVLREQMIRLVPISAPVLDTCGTGGDDSGTFNISTASALVAAAAGIPVVKHGNRAVSSRSGSADVLVALGVPIENGPEWSQRCLDRIGFAFCFAPQFHPGMAHVSRLRRTLGVRTIFNLLGPLANPASADYQLLGVGKPELLETLAGAVAELGLRRAVLVCSEDGLDEVSLSAPTQVRIVTGEEFTHGVWRPEEFGLGTVQHAEILADGPEASAAVIRSVFTGLDSPASRIVQANTAAALWTAGMAGTLREGVDIARETLRTGKAASLLEQLIKS